MALPVLDIKPAVKMFPAVALPVAEIRPPVRMLAPVMLAALVMVLVADTSPAVKIFVPVMLPEVTVPEVLIVLDPNAAMKLATLVLLYAPVIFDALIFVNNAPLPMI